MLLFQEAMSQQQAPEKGRGEENLHDAGGTEPGCAGAQEDAPHHKQMSEQERLKLWREQHKAGNLTLALCSCVQAVALVGETAVCLGLELTCCAA